MIKQSCCLEKYEETLTVAAYFFYDAGLRKGLSIKNSLRTHVVRFLNVCGHCFDISV